MAQSDKRLQSEHARMNQLYRHTFHAKICYYIEFSLSKKDSQVMLSCIIYEYRLNYLFDAFHYILDQEKTMFFKVAETLSRLMIISQITTKKIFS